MSASDLDQIRQTILDEFGVLEDDIHVSDDRYALTFYLPTGQLEKAEDIFQEDLEVLESHEYEYLVKVSY